MSGAGTGFDPLPSRERGILSVGVVLLLPRVVDVCQNQDLQDYEDLRDWDDALHRFMDSRLRGNDDEELFCLVHPRHTPPCGLTSLR